MIRAPRIYASVGVSGGVPDTEYFTFLLTVLIAEIICVQWLKDAIHAGRSTQWLHRHIRTPILILSVLFCLLFYRHLVGQTADYICINFITSGELQDYRTQMQEWLDILNDPDIKDARLPAMNSEQGPYMIMVPLPGDDGFSNYAYEQYYEKDSVITVPREDG